jgi:hypothetical protein
MHLSLNFVPTPDLYARFNGLLWYISCVLIIVPSVYMRIYIHGVIIGVSKNMTENINTERLTDLIWKTVPT